MASYRRLAFLRDEQHALRVARALEERGVRFVLRTYRDSAYDGLFQSRTAWGHIEAAAADRELVQTVVRDLAPAEAEVSPAPEDVT